MHVSEYDTTFTDKMKIVPHLVPTELSKDNKFANGLPAKFGPVVKIVRTLKEAIWLARNMETQTGEKGLERAIKERKGS